MAKFSLASEPSQHSARIALGPSLSRDGVPKREACICNISIMQGSHVVPGRGSSWNARSPYDTLAVPRP